MLILVFLLGKTGEVKLLLRNTYVMCCLYSFQAKTRIHAAGRMISV